MDRSTNKTHDLPSGTQVLPPDDAPINPVHQLRKALRTLRNNISRHVAQLIALLETSQANPEQSRRVKANATRVNSPLVSDGDSDDPDGVTGATFAYDQ